MRRSLLVLGLTTFAVTLALLAGDDKKQPAPQQQPPPGNVNITPRTRGKAPDPAADPSLDRKSNIRVDTTMVLIPVAVTDPMSRFVTGLDKENFKLFEDKVDQEITQFSSEDAPLSVGIVFD